MKKILLVCALAVMVNACKTKVDTTSLDPKDYTVTTQEIEDIVTFLASDDLKGRNTGTEGIGEAANYVESKFNAYGIKPFFDTYRDNFKVGDLDAYNVVGYLEGNDATLKNEFIVIGAHYDHIGQSKTVANDSIANGANDNAAGTSGVLALAKYFGAKKTNKRSLLFVTFSAEEKGLLGSAHLAKRLKQDNFNMYTMINLEMIGVPFKDRDYIAFVTGFDKSNIAQKINEYSGTKVVGYSEVAAKYNLFRQSDNYAFYKEFNLPCHTISSCDLSNYDYYHHVDDEADKLDYNHMVQLINSIIPGIEKMSNTPTKEITLNEN
ncbi:MULTISPECIES: M28 family peptidase [unclassified Olleya]|jgi:Zn-dependent M28 family amino/carboxypeptidase|uniref:M28 family peptidase n=1 Tax=unclassified Olleya TaxID=2615019 RepID=UPI00119D287D|nr:M28 family peptidase [Olleya sp. Hel_I_94]TVZ50135.1 peptidase M28-like protein [Olleya sp. Hel_I_94]